MNILKLKTGSNPIVDKKLKGKRKKEMCKSQWYCNSRCEIIGFSMMLTGGESDSN